MQDLTGTPPSDKDLKEALAWTREKLSHPDLTRPIDLLQVPNIRRCLQELLRLRSTYPTYPARF